ncbi:elongation factor 1-delta, partial [Salvelinus sp. IW2-2015]|uniref:elongation factor 1-delta n=1 Tax=Salvelinus sp. IW2-2015 TaxID=2691554 RepID=UPI0038D397C5
VCVVVEDLRTALFKLENRVQVLERSPAVPCARWAVTVQSVKVEEEDDDDMDLFGSDEEEDEEVERLKEERIAAYAAKKSKKPALIAKSSILLDVKPVRCPSVPCPLSSVLLSCWMSSLYV